MAKGLQENLTSANETKEILFFGKELCSLYCLPESGTDHNKSVAGGKLD